MRDSDLCLPEPNFADEGLDLDIALYDFFFPAKLMGVWCRLALLGLWNIVTDGEGGDRLKFLLEEIESESDAHRFIKNISQEIPK